MCFSQLYDVLEQTDEFGVRRRKAGNAEKYKRRVFKCPLCSWGYSNKYAAQAKKHKDDCPAHWIFEQWQPQNLQDLKFIKS